MILHPVPPGPFIGECLVLGFAVGWVVAGTRSLAGKWPAALSLAAVLVSFGVGWREYTGFRAGTHAPVPFHGAAYGMAVAFETLAIPLAAAWLKRGGKEAYLLPAVALIVGIHFFGLVWAFDSPACGWTGGAMCLLPIATVSCWPRVMTRRSDDGETRWWDVVVGLGCAAILWLAVLTQF